MDARLDTLTSARVRRLLVKAVHAYDEVIEAVRPIDRRIANTALDAYAGVASDVFMVCNTPWALTQAIREAAQNHGPRPPIGSPERLPRLDAIIDDTIKRLA